MNNSGLYLFILFFVILLGACGNEAAQRTEANNEQNKNTKEAASNEEGVGQDEHTETDVNIDNQAEGTIEDEDNTNVVSNDEVAELPKITEEAMDQAYSIINDYTLVKDSHIEVLEEDEKVILAIIVNAATNEEHAKELGDNFARGLGSGASIYGDKELNGPDKDDLGEIYDYYDLQVGVGTDTDNFIVRGAKVTSASKITW